MCEAGMLRTLMTFCRRTLSTSGSALHSLLIRIFEKLGSQAIEPDVLRQFLGLGIRSPQPAAWKSLHSSPGHEDNPGNS
ncbi:WD repeat- and FYVE domain-containing protein 4, partial [Lemmus lemmus]